MFQNENNNQNKSILLVQVIIFQFLIFCSYTFIKIFLGQQNGNDFHMQSIISVILIVAMCIYIGFLMLKIHNSIMFLILTCIKLGVSLILIYSFRQYYMILPILYIDWIIIFDVGLPFYIICGVFCFLSTFDNQKYIFNSDFFGYLSNISGEVKAAFVRDVVKNFVVTSESIVEKSTFFTIIICITEIFRRVSNRSNLNQEIFDHNRVYISELEKQVEELQLENVSIGKQYKHTLKEISNFKTGFFDAFNLQLQLYFKETLKEVYIHQKQGKNMMLVSKKIALGEEKFFIKNIDQNFDNDHSIYRFFKQIVSSVDDDKYIVITEQGLIYEMVSNNLSDTMFICKIIARKEEFYITVLMSKDIGESESKIWDKIETAKTLLKNKLEIEVELSEKSEALKIAFIDSKTKLWRADKIKEYEEEIFKKIEQNYITIVFDLDKFKSVNDEKGHLAGDMVLSKFGEIINKNINAERDVAIRFGGEEIVLFASIPNEKNDIIRIGVDIAERIRKALEAEIFQTENNILFKVTVSAGIYYGKNNNGLTLSSFMEKADKALYFSKKNGRNQVNVYNELEAEGKI